MVFSLTILLFLVLSSVVNTPLVVDNPDITKGIISTISFVKDGDYENAKEELDWIEMLIHYQDNSLLNSTLNNYQHFSFYRLKSIIDRISNQTDAYSKDLRLACSIIEKENSLYVDDILSCYFEVLLDLFNTMEVYDIAMVRQKVFDEPYFDDDIWDTLESNYVKNDTTSLLDYLFLDNIFHMMYMKFVSPEWVFNRISALSNSCSSSTEECSLIHSIHSSIIDCDNDISCYRYLFNKVSQSVPAQTYQHLHEYRSNLRWLFMILYSYESFASQLPSFNSSINVYALCKWLLSLTDRIEMLFITVIVIVLGLLLLLFVISRDGKKKKKQVMKKVNVKKVEKKKVVVKEEKQDKKKKKKRINNDKENTSSVNRKKESKNMNDMVSGYVDAIENASVLSIQLIIPCKAIQQSSFYLFMKDCSCIDLSQAKPMIIEGQTLYAWFLNQHDSEVTLNVLYYPNETFSKITDKSRKKNISSNCIEYCYGLNQTEDGKETDWILSDWHKCDMLAYNFSILPSLSIPLEEVSFPYWNSQVIAPIEEKKNDNEVSMTEEVTENSIEKKNDNEVSMVEEATENSIEKKNENDVRMTEESTEDSMEKKNDSEINAVQVKEVKPTVDDLTIDSNSSNHYEEEKSHITSSTNPSVTTSSTSNQSKEETDKATTQNKPRISLQDTVDAKPFPNPYAKPMKVSPINSNKPAVPVKPVITLPRGVPHLHPKDHRKEATKELSYGVTLDLPAGLFEKPQPTDNLKLIPRRRNHISKSQTSSQSTPYSTSQASPSGYAFALPPGYSPEYTPVVPLPFPSGLPQDVPPGVTTVVPATMPPGIPPGMPAVVPTPVSASTPSSVSATVPSPQGIAYAPPGFVIPVQQEVTPDSDVGIRLSLDDDDDDDEQYEMIDPSGPILMPMMPGMPFMYVYTPTGPMMVPMYNLPMPSSDSV